MASNAVHQLKRSRSVQFAEQVPSEVRPIPPPKPKQNITNVNKHLRILMRISDDRQYEAYKKFKKLSLKNAHTNFRTEDDDADVTPQEAFSNCPLRGIVKSEALKDLIRCHEIEAEIDFKRQQSGLEVAEVENSSSNQIDLWKSETPLNVSGDGGFVFREPLLRIKKYAVRRYYVDDYEQELPIIVFNCVEKLLEAKARDETDYSYEKTNKLRVEQLLHGYNQGPDFYYSLSREKPDTVYYLLEEYLNRLPHSILGDAVFEAIQKLCVDPEKSNNPDDKSYFLRSGDWIRVDIARELLKLMPSIHLSLFIYLCSFFLHFFEGQDLNAIAKHFADPLVIKSSDSDKETEASFLFVWILARIDIIITGLFDVEDDPGSMDNYGIDETEENDEPPPEESTSPTSSIPLFCSAVTPPGAYDGQSIVSELPPPTERKRILQGKLTETEDMLEKVHATAKKILKVRRLKKQKRLIAQIREEEIMLRILL